ncbi:MAG: hypothetical protein CL681_01855 [Blastopirellula sp.]|nr:hypothetical protein [Blastopirellula sp.]
MTSNTDYAEQLALTFAAVDALQACYAPFSGKWARVDQQRVTASWLRRYLRNCQDHDTSASLGGFMNYLATEKPGA